MTDPTKSRTRLFLGILTLACAAGTVRLVPACGVEISLGGTPDATVLDARSVDATDDADAAVDPPNDDCEPCTAPEDCHAGATCVEIITDASNTYCAQLCPTGAGCDLGETCRAAETPAGLTPKACVPDAGACPVASPPSGNDGGPLEACGPLRGPNVPAPCKSCRYECQANGCYGGWWCDTVAKRCVRPPKSCP